jgi:hypothetical protein
VLSTNNAADAHSSTTQPDGLLLGSTNQAPLEAVTICQPPALDMSGAASINHGCTAASMSLSDSDQTHKIIYSTPGCGNLLCTGLPQAGRLLNLPLWVACEKATQAQLNSTLKGWSQRTQMWAHTQLSTQLNSTLSTQLNSTQLNPTQCSSPRVSIPKNMGCLLHQTQERLPTALSNAWKMQTCMQTANTQASQPKPSEARMPQVASSGSQAALCHKEDAGGKTLAS